MISVTLTFNTHHEALEFLTTGNHDGFVASVSAPTAQPKKPAPKAKAKPVEKEVPPSNPEKLPANKDPYKAVKSAALKLTQDKGRDKLIEVLGSMGFKKATDAKVEDYPKLIAALEAAIAEPEELV